MSTPLGCLVDTNRCSRFQDSCCMCRKLRPKCRCFSAFAPNRAFCSLGFCSLGFLLTALLRSLLTKRSYPNVLLHFHVLCTLLCIRRFKRILKPPIFSVVFGWKEPCVSTCVSPATPSFRRSHVTLRLGLILLSGSNEALAFITRLSQFLRVANFVLLALLLRLFALGSIARRDAVLAFAMFCFCCSFSLGILLMHPHL